MKKFILLFIIFFGSFLFGQVKDSIQNQQEIYDVYIEEPLLISNKKTFLEVFKDNFNNKAFKGNIDIICEIKVIFDRDGILKTYMVYCNYLPLKKESEKAISKIKGSWSPGKANGQKSDIYIHLSLKISNGSADFVYSNPYLLH